MLYLSDFARAFWQAPVVLQHTWSLAVEAHFYLLWPAVLIGLLRLTPSRRVQVLLLLYLAALAWRSHNMLSVRDWAGVYYAFDTRVAGLLLGALAACGGRELGRGWAWLGLLALAVAVLQARWKADATILLCMPLAEIGTALLVSAAGALRAWSHDALAWLGRMSYGVYLWHYPVMYWMRPQGFAWVETLVVGSLVGLAGAVLSYYTVERAFRRSPPADLQPMGCMALWPSRKPPGVAWHCVISM